MPVLKGRDQIPINPDLERLVRVFKPSSGRGLQPEKRLSRTDALARRIHSPESIRKILGCLGLPCVRRQSRRSAIEFQNLPSHSCRQDESDTYKARVCARMLSFLASRVLCGHGKHLWLESLGHPA